MVDHHFPSFSYENGPSIDVMGSPPVPHQGLSLAEAKGWAQEALRELSAEGQHQDHQAEQQMRERRYQDCNQGEGKKLGPSWFGDPFAKPKTP
jgi:hypothetical protein